MRTCPLLEETLHYFWVHHLVFVHLTDLRSNDILSEALDYETYNQPFKYFAGLQRDSPDSRSSCSSSVNVSSELKPDCEAATADLEKALQQ